MTTPEQSRFDFDQEIESAWSEFTSALESCIRLLDDGESVLLETMGPESPEGTRPYVQFVSFADGEMVRCEVSGNAVLLAGARMTTTQEDALRAAGFTAPAGDADPVVTGWAPNWYRDEEASAPNVLAGLGVMVLREVLGVMHPSLLAHVPAPNGPSTPTRQLGAGDFEKVSLDTAYPVSSPDDLAELVDRTFVTLTSDVVERDDDGDWMLPFAGHMAWVSFVPDKPVIRIFALPVWGIRSRRAAIREVGFLNRDSELIRYHLVGDRLEADLELTARPFVPRHLAECVSAFQTTVAKVKKDFAARTGGHA